MGFLKKYWTHLISLGFLIYAIFSFGYINSVVDKEPNTAIMLIVISILLLFVIAVWVEIIYSIVHAVKHKEIKNNALCAVLNYFLNVVYIPCYYLKYVVKDEKSKKKNIVYIIVSSLLYIVLFIFIFKMALTTTEYKTYTTVDGYINFNIPDNYEYTRIGNYDIYFQNDYINTGVYLYDDYGYIDEELLKFHEEDLFSNRDDVNLIDTKTTNINNKKIITHTYVGIYNNNENIYRLSIISFDNKPDYLIYVLQSILKEYYDDNINEMNRVLERVSFNK